jgi:oligoribonuclease NrnB/cAMP/cGMP phosphodiesterase (DHH superfamily)
MAKPLYSENLVHTYFVPTRWAYPKEPLRARTKNEEIDYSETVTMQSGGGGHWEYCNMDKKICGHS